MNTNTVIRFLGWASLTYLVLEVNCFFLNAVGDAIIDAIKHNNKQIRLKAMTDYYELLKRHDRIKSEDESEDESEGKSEGKSENESEVETEVVVETVTKTISKP